MGITNKLTRRHFHAWWGMRVLPSVHRRSGFIFPPVGGKRMRARWIEPYDEWSVIHDPVDDAAAPTPELVRLLCRAAEVALDVDLMDVAGRTDEPVARQEIQMWPGQHYRLLVALAQVTGARNVVEIGTAKGASALAFLSLRTVERVTTYDIAGWQTFPETLLRTTDFDSRLEQRLVDLMDAEAFDRNLDVLKESDLIFVDGPKSDGEFERILLDRIVSMPRSKPQLLVIDDVKVLPMVKLWARFPLPKIDASTFGHWSGTGLVQLEPTDR
jgi:predicted O-methyltransferase YrrM